MAKIQGIENLLIYLESVGYPLTEQQIQNFLTEKKIPHSKPFGELIVFDCSHIDWWVKMQRETDSLV